MDQLPELLPQYVSTVLARYRKSEAAQKEEFGICHCDLNLSNLLADSSTRKIVAVLDWEKAQCTLYDEEISGGTAASHQYG
jgi:aminoglycoside phosphotransferase (APT) family kinase protein